jgi:hypothetical protein
LNFYINRASNAAPESFNAKIKRFRTQLREVVDIPFFLYWLTIAHMGLRLLLKNTKEEKNRIPLMKQQAPTDTYKRKLPIWLASNSFFNHSLTKGQKQKKEDIPVLTGISSLT